MKIATWNVNSLKVRLPHVMDWLNTHQPDILALQEIKMLDEFFPYQELNNLGYECVWNGQKAYNGVAILSREKTSNIVKELPGLDDPQRRVLSATIAGVRVVNVYIPNGESISSEKYSYKLNWLKTLETYLQDEMKAHSKLIILGDFNIAPEKIDLYDHSIFEGQVLFTEAERNSFQNLLKLGLTDCLRAHDISEKTYTWWDYRLNAFKRNMGLRIDHILATGNLVKQSQRCYVDKAPRALERPSDHAPVIAEFD